MTDSMIRFVGLDVHKRVVEARLVDAAGKVVRRERFALNRQTLKRFATKARPLPCPRFRWISLPLMW